MEALTPVVQRGLRLVTLVVAFAIVTPNANVRAQVTHTASPAEEDGEDGVLRRALLIGGVAVSMAAYGYFTLEFNNSRGDAIDAERAYEEDVRLNAQSYVDQGVALDQIQTFRRWQEAFDDAKSSREWGARTGLLAILIGFFAVVDASTSYDGPSPRLNQIEVRPTVGLDAASRDLVVGARMKF